MDRRGWQVLFKVGLLLVVVGFFMPVSCNQNGFEIAEQLSFLGDPGSDAYKTSILLYILFASAAAGGLLLILNKHSLGIDWLLLFTMIGSGLLAWIFIMDDLFDISIQAGGYLIIFGWILSSISLIAASMASPSEIDSGIATELSDQDTSQAQRPRSLSYTSSSLQRDEEPVDDPTVMGNYDFSDRMSLRWPVEAQSGILMKRDGQGGKEDLSCTVTFKNVQSREILYTEWQLKCFDILKKPILTEIPVIIRHEANLRPKETVTVKSSDPLPPGTRSFIPHLKAVLYADQKIEEFSDDELIPVKPRAEVKGLKGFNQAALEQYRQANNLVEVPQYIHENDEALVWTCGFCGTRNIAGDHECRLCSAGLEQQKLCSREPMERFFVDYAAHLEHLEKMKRKQQEEEEQERLEEEERKAQEAREQEERKRKRRAARLKKIALVFLILVIIAGVGFTLWKTVFENMYWYNEAQKAMQAGQSYEAYELYHSLGGYKDARELSFENYRVFLELDSSVSEEDQIAGWRWLHSKGYGDAKAVLYEMAGKMVENGRFYLAYELFIELADFKDAREQAKALTVTVTFDPQGGTLSENQNSIAVVIGGTLPAPIRVGYIFDGWWTGKNGAGEQVTSDSIVSVSESQTLYAKWKDFIVGDISPSGGHIFYDKGSYSDGWRYLEAAPAKYEYNKQVWGGFGTTVWGTGTAIGTGKSNTEKIVARFGNAEPYANKADYAAKVCADLVVTKDGIVYDDWFLPSKGELDLMYDNLKVQGLGGFSDSSYWGSSEHDGNYAWYQGFNDGNQIGYSYRFYEKWVRPVRAF